MTLQTLLPLIGSHKKKNNPYGQLDSQYEKALNIDLHVTFRGNSKQCLQVNNLVISWAHIYVYINIYYILF